MSNHFKEVVHKVVPPPTPFAVKSVKNFYVLAIVSAILMIAFIAIPNAVTFFGAGTAVFFTSKNLLLSRQPDNQLEQKMYFVLKSVAEYNVDIAIRKAKNPNDSTLREQNIGEALSLEFGMKFVAELNDEQKKWIEETYAASVDEITGVGTQYRYVSDDLNDSTSRVQRQIAAMYRGREELGTL